MKNKDTKKSDQFWLNHQDRCHYTHFRRRPSWREQRREQVMNDWFGSQLARGEIRDHQRPAVPINQPLDALMREFGKGRQVLLEQIKEKWVNLVGADIARQTQPLCLYHQCLEIEVNHAMWLYELQTKMKPDLTKRLVEFSENQIHTLRFLPAGRRR